VRVGTLGRRLWALAAERLGPEALREERGATGIREVGIGEVGIGEADLIEILALCRGVWRHAAALWDAVEDAADGPPDGVVRAALAGPSREDPAIFAACLATLLRIAAAPGRVAAIAAGFSPALRRLSENVLVSFVEAALPRSDGASADPGAAAEAALRFASAIDDIEAADAWRGPEWRARLNRLRRDGGNSCHGIFAAGLDTLLLAPFASLAATPDAPEAEMDETVLMAEEAARNLKRLELSGRRIGDPGRYEGSARDFLDALTVLRNRLPEDATTGLRRIDVARLAEILFGRDAAVRILEGA